MLSAGRTDRFAAALELLPRQDFFMPHYRIEGTQQSSGRKNTRAVYALGVDHAKELAEEKGISVEFCERQEDAPPTDRQIEPPRLSWRLFGLSHAVSATRDSASCR